MNNREPRLPSSAPVGVLLACLFSLLSAALVFLIWCRTAQPLRTFYLATYVNTSLPSFQAGKHRKLVDYKVLMSGAYPAVAGSSLAKARVGNEYSYPKEFHAWLKRFVYDGDSTATVFLWPLAISAAIFALALIPALIYDGRAARIRRTGLKVRGPELLTVRQFNRTVKGNGLAFLVAEDRDR